MAVNPSRASRIRPHLNHSVKATACFVMHCLSGRRWESYRGLLPHDVANKCLRHSILSTMIEASRRKLSLGWVKS